jgi:hypothetical protein
VLRYARSEVRAALFKIIQGAFHKEPGARSADEALMVNVFTRLVREKHIQAATASLNEYHRWQRDPCAYRPPTGFTYNMANACIGGSQLFTPESPGLEAFVAYGVKQAYADTRVDDPRASAVFWATSNAALLGYSVLVTSGLSAAGAAVGSTLSASNSLVTSIMPFAVRAFLDAGSAAAAGSSAAGSGGASAAGATGATAGAAGAATVGGLVALLVSTVSTIVIASITLEREAAIPSKLQQGLDAAQSYDLAAAIRNNDKAAVGELYGFFIANTLPDYPGTDPAPARGPGDPQFYVDGRPVAWLEYIAADGAQHAVRMIGPWWFADRAASAAEGEARLKLSISYRDKITLADETGQLTARWTTRKSGRDQLLTAFVADPATPGYPAPTQSADLTVVQRAAPYIVTARLGG